MQEIEQQKQILQTQIEQLEKDIQEAQEKIKTVTTEEDKSLLIHIISSGEMELSRLRKELETLMN